MNFTTQIPISKHKNNISHKDKIMLLGSCFTENIGNKLSINGFETLINPFGILYNPFSICSSLNRIIYLKFLDSEDLVKVNEFWFSYEHHGVFRDEKCDNLLQTINLGITKANLFLKQTNWLIITLGTAWVFFLKENNKILGNCHKLNPQLIDKKLLSVDEIVENTSLTINNIREINPNIKIILTVSPIRHWKQGYRENIISKSTLHLATNQLCETINDCFYFPAYEIVMDELRDYRFYQADMLHPSEIAVDYIWEKFSTHLFSDSTANLCKDYYKLHSMKQHKAFNPESQGYKNHLIKIAKLEKELYEKRNKLI
ncbi:MAG: GSCFA domain-containing protein [Bacteroidales bacterium]|nr:GSCFA domain-containing protein [Bacteroidales bacterium]